MARVHYWQFIIDEEGRPIEGADITIFLANSNEPAYIYEDEIGGAPLNSAPQLTTNTEGFFEFWIGDSSEVNGYKSTQKFKIYWERIGIAAGMIDYVDIFPPTMPVDETDDNSEKNKSVSNKLAKAWETHRNDVNHIVHGIREYDSLLDDEKKNKLISNHLANLWQRHRRFSFDTNLIAPSGENELASWEISGSDSYGAHGLKSVEVSGSTASDTMFNRLINNALGNKWNEHVDFSFETHTEGTSGFEKTPHDLEPVNYGPLSENPTTEQISEFNKFNKLVSNRLINSIIDSDRKRAIIKQITINEGDWITSVYNDGFYVRIFHELSSLYPQLTFYRDIDLRNEDGIVQTYKAIFQPQNVIIINDSEFIVYASTRKKTEIIMVGQYNKLDGME